MLMLFYSGWLALFFVVYYYIIKKRRVNSKSYIYQIVTGCNIASALGFSDYMLERLGCDTAFFSWQYLLKIALALIISWIILGFAEKFIGKPAKQLQKRLF